jgi:hypothetical protein
MMTNLASHLRTHTFPNGQRRTGYILCVFAYYTDGLWLCSRAWSAKKSWPSAIHFSSFHGNVLEVQRRFKLLLRVGLQYQTAVEGKRTTAAFQRFLQTDESSFALLASQNPFLPQLKYPMERKERNFQDGP